MRNKDKTKNMEELNKRLLGESVLNENEDLSQQVMDLTKRVYELEKMIKGSDETPPPLPPPLPHTDTMGRSGYRDATAASRAK